MIRVIEKCPFNVGITGQEVLVTNKGTTVVSNDHLILNKGVEIEKYKTAQWWPEKFQPEGDAGLPLFIQSGELSKRVELAHVNLSSALPADCRKVQVGFSMDDDKSFFFHARDAVSQYEKPEEDLSGQTARSISLRSVPYSGLTRGHDMKFDEIKYQIQATWGSIDDDAIPYQLAFNNINMEISPCFIFRFRWVASISSNANWYQMMTSARRPLNWRRYCSTGSISRAP